MPISNTKQLFGLIKSLTKADKRNFRLYAKRVQSDDSMKFIQLFDILDKQSSLDEKKVLEKMPKVGKSQYANLKRHLYKQILTSLRLLHINRIDSIGVREQIDFAHVLYSKSLFHQSLKILQRAKRLAYNNNLPLLVLEIIEFQKMIESRHITHTGPIKNDALTMEAKELVERVYTSVLLSNLRVRLHGYYIKNSHVKSEAERNDIITFFNENIPRIEEHQLPDTERIHLYQSYVWYFYILLDFEQCFDYALKWIEVFENNPELKLRDPDLYMRGHHYLLTVTYNLGSVDRLKYFLNQLQTFRKTSYARFNENSKIFSFLYVHWARYNVHFLEGSFKEGLALIPKTLRRLNRYKGRIAPHRIMVFYFKIAWLYLGNDDPGMAVTYINKILNQKTLHFREDIQIYSHLLYLMAHYDLDNIDLLPYLIKTVESFFKKIKVKNKLQLHTIKFFKKVHTLSLFERMELFKEFYAELTEIRKDPFEKRAFIYLDIVSWVESKISKRPISEVIQEYKQPMHK